MYTRQGISRDKMRQSTLLSFTRKIPQHVGAGSSPASAPQAPQAESPLLSNDEERDVASADGAESIGGSSDDECEVVNVQTRSSSPSPAASTTQPPLCSGFKPQLDFPMAMNWPFGLVNARQPWDVIVRGGVLVLIAKSVAGDQTTAGCSVTVACEGDTCSACQSLKDNTMLKGEVQAFYAGPVCACPIFQSPPSYVVRRTIFSSSVIRNGMSSVLLYADPNGDGIFARLFCPSHVVL